jgi:glycosyltransferase involved in cell wall biosynthesis
MGGAERWLVGLAGGLARAGFVHAGIASTGEVCAEDDPRILAEARALGPVYRGRGSIAAMVGSAGPDLLVVWGLAELPGAERFGGPVVLVSHGCGPFTRDVLKRCGPRATHWAAVSRPAAAAFPGQGTGDREQGTGNRGQGTGREFGRVRRPLFSVPCPLSPVPYVAVLHNGIDPDRCQLRAGRHSLRRTWGLRPTEIAVGYVGRMSLEKHPLAACWAVSALDGAADRAARAVLVGAGGHQDLVFREARRSTPGLVWAGPLDEMGDVYAALDVAILASPSEGMSLGLLEAWYCGCPTVATPVGAVAELEELHGQLTQRVRVGAERSELAAAVRQALAPEFAPVVQRARQAVRAHYTLAAMVDRWRDYLFTALGNQAATD